MSYIRVGDDNGRNSFSFGLLDESVLNVDKSTLQLWLGTLLGLGYIKKINTQNYSLTEKGKEELEYHKEPLIR